VGGEKAIAILKKSLATQYPLVDEHDSAIVPLGQIGGEAVIPLLEKELADTHWVTNRNAALALGQVGGLKAVAALTKGLASEDEALRSYAAEALYKAACSEAVPILTKALEHTDESVRGYAGLALASVLAEKAVPILEKAGVEVPWDLLHEAGRERRVARTEEILVTQEDWGCGPQPLFRALADEFGGDKSVAIIEKALTNKQPSVRSAAAYALGTVGGPKAVPPLEKALIDGDPTVRSSAAWALGHIRGRSARDLLIAKLEVERDPTVYGVIHTTLKRAFPEDPVVTEALAKAPPISP